MKKFLWVLLLSIVLSLFCGFTDSVRVVEVELWAREKVVLNERFFVNPDIRADDVDVLRGCVETYGETAMLDYIYGDLGKKLDALYGELDEVKVSDCVRFIPRSRERFIYDASVGRQWVKRGEVIGAVLDSFGKDKISVELDFCEGDSRYSDDELRSYTQKVSTFSTSYANSTAGRKTNIARAAEYISGTVVEAGKSFSFNTVVGKRTKERGFREAKVIVDGSFTEGVGGGVCQVATTLYNSAIRADMRVDRCVRHTLAPSYVDLSFDAMVSEWCDLVFTNTTDSPVFIEAYADGATLSVTFYSRARGYDLRFESVVKEVVRHPLYDGTNGDVYRNGYKSEGYKVITRGGRVVSRRKMRSDYYKPYEVKRVENNGNLE